MTTAQQIVDGLTMVKLREVLDHHQPEDIIGYVGNSETCPLTTIAKEAYPEVTVRMSVGIRYLTLGAKFSDDADAAYLSPLMDQVRYKVDISGGNEAPVRVRRLHEILAEIQEEGLA